MASQQAIQRQQTAAGGAVVAGAEGERGFDLDTDAVGLQARTVVPPMHQEAARLNRCEAFETSSHPVSGLDPLKYQRVRQLRADFKRDQRADRGLVWRRAEMDRGSPAPVLGF